MTRHWLTAAFLAAAFISAVPLRGSDDDARVLLREARNEYKEKDYYSAASKSLDAEHMADSVELKAEAVKLAVLSYRKEKLYYREFQNIEKPSHHIPSSHCSSPESIAFDCRKDRTRRMTNNTMEAALA